MSKKPKFKQYVSMYVLAPNGKFAYEHRVVKCKKHHFFCTAWFKKSEIPKNFMYIEGVLRFRSIFHCIGCGMLSDADLKNIKKFKVKR